MRFVNALMQFTDLVQMGPANPRGYPYPWAGLIPQTDTHTHTDGRALKYNIDVSETAKAIPLGFNAGRV
jgi:hypothetical protein